MNYDLRPPQSDFSVMQGDTFPLRLTVRNPAVAPATVGTPVNLTGCTIAGRIRRGATSYPFAVVSRDDLNGVVNLELSSTVMAGLSAGPYDYDIEITDTLGQTRKYARGVISVTSEATRA